MVVLKVEPHFLDKHHKLYQALLSKVFCMQPAYDNHMRLPVPFREILTHQTAKHERRGPECLIHRTFKTGHQLQANHRKSIKSILAVCLIKIQLVLHPLEAVKSLSSPRKRNNNRVNSKLILTQ